MRCWHLQGFASAFTARLCDKIKFQSPCTVILNELWFRKRAAYELGLQVLHQSFLSFTFISQIFLCTQQIHRPAFASSQSYHSICCSLSINYNTYTFYISSFKNHASICSLEYCLDPSNVVSPIYRFSCDKTHILPSSESCSYREY